MKSFLKGIGILIFAVVIGTCLGCFSNLWASTTNPIVVAVISADSKAQFESKIEPLLKEQLKNCSTCSVRNITPYTAEGIFDPGQVPAQIELARSSSSFFFLHWNVKVVAEHKPAMEALIKLADSGVIIIAAAGMAKESEATLPLKQTLAGQIPGVIIIGELALNETFPTQAFFGPEMLTAVKPPKEYIGQGLGSLFFVSKLATQWNKRTAPQWVEHFNTTKTKVRRIWPSLNDFF